MRTKRHVAVIVLALTSLGLVGPAHATTTHTARLSAAQEVPTNESKARGQAVFQLSAEGTELNYRLIVANIDNVTASHIHLAPEGVNGPVVAFLYGNAPAGSGSANGVLATGTITATDLTGPLAGTELTALITAIEAGNAYVNVHTNDGIAPANTGPGDFPGGEIRGQIS